MFENFKSRAFYITLIVAGGLVFLFSMLYGPISSQTVGGKDWIDAFRNGARGDYSLVVTPYWSLFLSIFPAQIPEPFGYIIWITLGAFLVIITAKYFKSPLLAVILSYQMSWVLYYGQIDPFILFGIGLGYNSILNKKPFWLGIAMSLVTIKPQIGLLLAIYFFVLSSSKIKTAIAFLLIVLASMLIWPGWPERLIFKQIIPFMSRPQNNWTNTSLRIPFWTSLLFSLSSLMAPMSLKNKIPLLLATNLLVSPYSTIYSQLLLLSVGLPYLFNIFGFIPWAVTLIAGPFGNWQWGFIFPLCVVLYLYYVVYKQEKLVKIWLWRINYE